MKARAETINMLLTNRETKAQKSWVTLSRLPTKWKSLEKTQGWQLPLQGKEG